MKAIVALALLAGCGERTYPLPDASILLDDRLASHLPLDDADFGDVVRLAQGIHATCSACPTIVPAHLLNGGQFTPDESLALVTGPQLTTTPYTIAFWISIADANADCPLTDAWKLCVQDDDLLLTGAGLATTGHLLAAPGWHHVAVRIGGAVSALSIDGGEVTAGVDMLDGDPSSLTLGGGFTGAIDDVRIWTRALNDFEVSALARE